MTEPFQHAVYVTLCVPAINEVVHLYTFIKSPEKVAKVSPEVAKLHFCDSEEESKVRACLSPERRLPGGPQKCTIKKTKYVLTFRMVFHQRSDGVSLFRDFLVVYVEVNRRLNEKVLIVQSRRECILQEGVLCVSLTRIRHEIRLIQH